MKRRSLVACLALLVSHLGLAVAQAPSADELAIRQTIAAYANAVTAGDLKRWSATLTDNVVFLPPDHRQLDGKRAVTAWAKQSFFDPFKTQFELQVGEVQVLGTWAFALGHFKLDTVPKSGGAAAQTTGKFLSIFHREKDGVWRYARAAHNFDPAAGTAPKPKDTRAGTR